MVDVCVMDRFMNVKKQKSNLLLLSFCIEPLLSEIYGTSAVDEENHFYLFHTP